MKLRSLKLPLSCLLGALLLLDVFVGYRSWSDRPWLQLQSVEGEPNALRLVSVWTWADSVLLGLIAVLEIVLGYLVWRSWRTD